MEGVRYARRYLRPLKRYRAAVLREAAGKEASNITLKRHLVVL